MLTFSTAFGPPNDGTYLSTSDTTPKPQQRDILVHLRHYPQEYASRGPVIRGNALRCSAIRGTASKPALGLHLACTWPANFTFLLCPSASTHKVRS